MAENEKDTKDIKVRIAQGDMEAYLSLTEREEGMDYTKDEVLAAMKQEGVHYGVDEELVVSIIEGRQYNQEFLVAKGKAPEDGEDGFYQYNFNLDFNSKPTIRPDGTVDYWSIHAVEIVEEGQVLAVYHESILGENGMDVRGKVIQCKKGRPQPPLTGKGFDRSEDNKIYTANITGKIEFSNNRLQVLPIYEIYGNVDLTTGNIDFRGDVLVHGNVTTGTSIKATGTVTVDGTAEACRIEAGKDVILRGGFLGGYKGIIISQGNVTAKFMEYATIEAEGSIEASSALNCNIKTHDRLFLSGRNAAIVGGHAYATRGIECDCIGNEYEIRTEISVGVLKETVKRLYDLEQELNKDNEMLEKINTGLKQFDLISEEKGVDLKNDERRLALLRARIAKQADVAARKTEQTYLKGIVEAGTGAEVRCIQHTYAGVVVSVGDNPIILKEQQDSVCFKLYNGKVMMFSLAGELVG